MSADDNARLLFLIGCIVLVASGLAARRLSFGQIWKPALAWVAIFLGLFFVIAERDRLTPVTRWFRSFDPDAGIATGETLRIRKSGDGHFWIRGQVNGREIRFLIDSGASFVALSSAEAELAGIKEDNGGFGVALDTANGTIVASRGHIAELEVGPIIRKNLSVVMAPEFGDSNVLGMNFLSSLSSWKVEGDTLILTS
ncbi:retropepsin-like aspartic protease family protein [Flavisphingomonas formosensis]|uniref:retropepsin-like aspartic protease family protein n=1 Tax=Flavisphingomonas formosensis TaxID=861534 RepID=UPI0012FB1824|nr:TIGR02281 family clan AA aspartic protease [Sphingomonas formosensis]